MGFQGVLEFSRFFEVLCVVLLLMGHFSNLFPVFSNIMLFNFYMVGFPSRCFPTVFLGTPVSLLMFHTFGLWPSMLQDMLSIFLSKLDTR